MAGCIDSQPVYEEKEGQPLLVCVASVAATGRSVHFPFHVSFDACSDVFISMIYLFFCFSVS